MDRDGTSIARTTSVTVDLIDCLNLRLALLFDYQEDILVRGNWWMNKRGQKRGRKRGILDRNETKM